MSWGHELWDQYENISLHTHKGIEFLDKYGSFVKERCAIEMDYAAKLRRLVKTHQYKKKDEEELQYTYIKAFLMMLQEIQDLAGQHEIVAENMTAHIAKEITMMVKELKDERKRYLNDGQKHQTSLHYSLCQLDKSKKSYEKAYKEAEKAQDTFQKVDLDLNLSRAEVEKARLCHGNKTQLCEDAKTEYANQLTKTNELQKSHYGELLPKVFVQLQDMEIRRITCVREYIKQSANYQRDVFPIVNKCLDGINRAADSINPDADCELVVEKFKSGIEPPEDVPFDDLSNPARRVPSESSHIGTGLSTLNYSNSISSSKKPDTIKARLKNRKGIFGIFGSKQPNDDTKEEPYADLPPVQRRKRIQAKIDSIQTQIGQETAVRDGLNKMKGAYEQNPALGDPATIEGQLSENGHRMEKLQADMRKFQGYLNEFNGKGGLSPGNRRKGSNNRSSASDGDSQDLSRSPSENSVNQQSLTQPLPDNNNEAKNSPSPSQQSQNHSKFNHNHIEDGEATSQTDDVAKVDGDTSVPVSNGSETALGESQFNNITIRDADADEPDGADGFDADLLPPLGRAKALYTFEAQSEGAIGMTEGEEFNLIEVDQGDGWTRVRRTDYEEGFVPTSYIEFTLFDK